MDPAERALPFIILLLAVLVFGWFLVGGEYNRRRAGRLAQWAYRGLQPFLGRASIRWITTHVFELFVEEPRGPFTSLKVTGLLESRDMIAVWLYNRLAYRPDLLVLRANLRRKPLWGCEVFRPGTFLAGDALREAESEGWSVRPLDVAGLRAWHGGGRAADLCARLVAEARASGFELVRLAAHRSEPHLLLAVSAASFDRQDARRLFEALRKMAEVAEAFA